MKTRPLFASLLMISSAIVAPAVLAAESKANSAPLPHGDTTTDAARAADNVDGTVDVSIPGGRNADIVVTGRFTPNVVRSTPEVVSLLSAEDIARTGDGDIAGSLQRVTGLSVVGGGFVYVRGLGDRYSLALLNGSPLPSPEPLKRVVPLDIFPTNVIDSTMVQKSYSVNFPGEFGGGVINLTTKSIPRENFLTLSGGIGWNSETTNQLGYTYYGSKSDWTGFDNGARDVPPLLAAAMKSGNPIEVSRNFSSDEIKAMMMELNNSATSLLQTNKHLPVNWSASVTGGANIDLADGTLGIIATAGISNKWRTRDSIQQTSTSRDLSGGAQTDFQRVTTDNQIVVNAMLGLGLELGDHKLRFTNLFIRDTLKQGSLAAGTDEQLAGFDVLRQETAWYARQLFNSQLAGEFRFGELKLDLRGGYAKSQRDAPYERSFTYVRTNLPTPTGGVFVNQLGGSRGSAGIVFSELDETLWSGGIDLSYEIMPRVTVTTGYAYSDTRRDSTRRSFAFDGTNLPVEVAQLRPDYLLSDASIQAFDIRLVETSAQSGAAAFDAMLRTHAGYGQIQAEIASGVNINLGVRYETADQVVTPIDLFGNAPADLVPTNLNKSYWLPAITVTWEVAPDMQLRANASKTIARPQFRELIEQLYQDPESNRSFRGNPLLVDSQLWNAELRYEYYFAQEQRVTIAGFYKSLDNPIETYTTISDSAVYTSYANAPKATLYGVETEVQKYLPLTSLGNSAFWQDRRLALIANYTFSQSKISVKDGDTTQAFRQTLPAASLFRDGAPLTGQSDHLANLQIGLEDVNRLSQQTLMLTYSSPRVTSRGGNVTGLPGDTQPDLREKPGLQLDFVARQGFDVKGREVELKFEARNLTGRDYQEVQESGENRVIYNRYKLGRTFSLSASLKF